MRRPRGLAARVGAASFTAGVIAFASSFASPCRAVDFGVTTIGGATFLDPHLADYRWDTAPRAIWGVQGMVAQGRWGIGARAWTSRTSQETGLLVSTGAPSVRLTGVELVGEPTLLDAYGFRAFASATAGFLHLGWSPDRLTLDASGGGEEITVEYAPIDTWTGSAGVGLRRGLPGNVTLGFAVERTFFSLETAHRVDDVVVEERERFGNWTVRLELSRWFLST